MQIEVRVEAAAPLLLLRNGQKRMAYAIVNAINATAKAVQAEERARVSRTVTLRKAEFIRRQIAIIKPFASVAQGRLEARVSIGEKPRLLLSELETGGIRKPFRGRRVAVPLTGGPARPTFAQPVPEEFTVKALHLVRVRAGAVQKTRKGRSRRERRDVSFRAVTARTGTVQFKGAHRTFILPQTAKAPEGGIFQRVGPGRDDIRLIYPFVTPPRLPRALHWMETGQRIAHQVFARELERQVASAFAYAAANAARAG